MNAVFKISSAAALFAAPLMAFAATLTDTLNTVNQLVGLATPIVVALALIYFFYGLGMLILDSSDDAKRKKAISIMIYGIIALFVMVSIWGIVTVLQNTFDVGAEQTITPPTVEGVGN
jgi:uncharacterized protein YhhL (DUF1145 family)